MCAQNWLQNSSMTGKLLSYANILLVIGKPILVFLLKLIELYY
ncbi:hypothetical protein LINPERPRIM_LOCUS5146 [Linum perenne]